MSADWSRRNSDFRPLPDSDRPGATQRLRLIDARLLAVTVALSLSGIEIESVT